MKENVDARAATKLSRGASFTVHGRWLVTDPWWASPISAATSILRRPPADVPWSRTSSTPVHRSYGCPRRSREAASLIRTTSRRCNGQSWQGSLRPANLIQEIILLLEEAPNRTESKSITFRQLINRLLFHRELFKSRGRDPWQPNISLPPRSREPFASFSTGRSRPSSSKLGPRTESHRCSFGCHTR